ncbi:hypothetical protein JCM24511_08839 [Saitozyma sp. JCM 24511]|nr:hypothetical protein JCM24511_08839 [Saitozyma sp. JCM 24511]
MNASSRSVMTTSVASRSGREEIRDLVHAPRSEVRDRVRTGKMASDGSAASFSAVLWNANDTAVALTQPVVEDASLTC